MTKVRLATAGSSVEAQLQAALPPSAFSWSDALVVMSRDVAVPPEPARNDYVSNESHMAARARYVHDPAVLGALRAVKNYVGQVDAEGSLLVEQVPPGRYVLEVKLYEGRHRNFVPGLNEPRLQARLRLIVTVPETEEHAGNAPALKLGELTLECL